MADRVTEPKKFQTRAGISRKTKEEREQYARNEVARQQQRLAESAQTPTTSAPEKGKLTGRGRLTALSNSTNRIRSENTGGVFGAAAPSLPKPRGGRPAASILAASEEVAQPDQQESSKASSVVKKKSKALDVADEPVVKSGKKTTARPRPSAAKKDDPVFPSSEEDDDQEFRRDIEQIWISSDEELVSSRPNGKQRHKSLVRHGTALRPLRAPRDSRVEGEAISARNRLVSTFGRLETNPAGEDAIRGPRAKDDNAMDVSDKMLLPPTGEVDKKTSKRKGTRLKDAVTVTETAEEHAERIRYNEEVRKLVGELDCYKSISQAGAIQAHGSEGFHHRRLYLFQFPPLTPVLADPAQEIEVKQEPEVELLPVPSASEKTNGAAVKKEEGAEDKTKRSDVLTADSMQFPSGLAGTLRVHKSGKVTLDWGGTDLEVRYGTEVDFLQDVVMIDETEQTAWALGQVEKKMVCIPNWQKLYE